MRGALDIEFQDDDKTIRISNLSTNSNSIIFEKFNHERNIGKVAMKIDTFKKIAHYIDYFEYRKKELDNIEEKFD